MLDLTFTLSILDLLVLVALSIAAWEVLENGGLF